MLNQVAKRSAKAVALAGGIRAGRRPGDVVILLYHRLGADTRSEIELDGRTFARHLERIVAKDTPRSLEDAISGGEGVVVTFDDGTRDFYESALPLLVSHRVPALLYLATGGVATNGNASPDALTWKQLEEATATGLVTIGSHTHSHADLAAATEREADEEMRRSKELIEDRLGVSCRHFAYPWGLASPDAERVARRLFATAALDGWRVNRRAAIDPYRLARIPVLRSDGQFFFRAKLRGRLNGEAMLYRVAHRGPWRPR